MQDRIRAVVCVGLASTAAWGCVGSGDDAPGSSLVKSTGGVPSAGDGSGAEGDLGTGGTVLLVDGSGGSTGSEPEDAGEGGACASTHVAAELQPVYLAFALDVSGSMGKLDFPWHDPVLKWQPVVAATTAFFNDPASTGLSASLTFFPASSDRCEASVYEVPDVPMTELPSPAFGAAIQAVTPQSADDWRGGTPSLAIVEGTITMLDALAAVEPNATYAIVLVTDGYPQGCDDQSIEAVAATVQGAVGRFPTYVIGVRNPPLAGAPDTVSDLEAIAVAGGTGHAFFIDTGDPGATTASFLTVVNGIRNQTLSCNIQMPPPPPGREFDAQRVAVRYTSGTASTELSYDPSCASTMGWHYDDPSAPTMIHLCPATCDAVQSDPEAELSVEFACEIQIPLLY